MTPARFVTLAWLVSSLIPSDSANKYTHRLYQQHLDQSSGAKCVINRCVKDEGLADLPELLEQANLQRVESPSALS